MPGHTNTAAASCRARAREGGREGKGEGEGGGQRESISAAAEVSVDLVSGGRDINYNCCAFQISGGSGQSEEEAGAVQVQGVGLSLR